MKKQKIMEKNSKKALENLKISENKYWKSTVEK
jgi:hypothetical protein